MRYSIMWIMVFMRLFSSPLEAQDHLVISRAQFSSAPGALMGERILKEAYSRIGRDIKLQKLPSIRAMRYANEGKMDGTFLRVAGLEQAYPNLFMIPIPVGYEDVVVYTKETKFVVDGWQSLSPYTIGLVRGFKLADINTVGMRVERANTFEQVFLMLDSGRTDVVVELKSKQCLLNNLDVSGIRTLEPPIDRIVLYHYLHIRHKSIAAELETVLTRMERAGELKRIQERAIQDFQESCGQ